ncbi:MAG: 30S ribosomal protein S6e [Halobacteriaceae archaeon]
MATFVAVVSNSETGQSYQVEVDGQDANRFLGREIGDEVDGDAVGLPGYTVEITGGSDAAGRPMRSDISGSGIESVLLAGGVGFDPERDGERKRQTVRGREVGDETAQLNLNIVKQGEESVPVLLGLEEPDEDESGSEEEETEE